MTWEAKPESPEYFSLADAFLALVTGDPTWGWLVDWATLIPNAGQNTAEFCALGPPTNDPFTSELFNQTAGAGALGQAGHLAALAVAVTNAAYERVFAAYCQQPGIVVDGWSTSVCVAINPAPSGNKSEVHIDVPTGATQMRFRLESYTPGGGGGSLNLQVYGNNASNGNEGLQGSYDNVGPWPTGWTQRTVGAIVLLRMENYATNGSGVFCVQFNVAVPGPPYDPTPQPQPPGVGSPLGSTPGTLDDIAHELDVQEFKLENIWSLLQSIAGATVDLGGELDDATVVEPDAAVPLGEAVGVIVTASGIPPESTVGFGDPQEVVKLGRLVFGTDVGWYPIIPITHTPFTMRPLPPGTTRFSITGVPPMVSMTFQRIMKNK